MVGNSPPDLPMQSTHLIQLHDTLSTLIDETLVISIIDTISTLSKEAAWQKISQSLLQPSHPFSLHLFIFKTLYPEWPQKLDSAPAWIPPAELWQTANLANKMKTLGFSTVKAFHRWSTEHSTDFWEWITRELKISFIRPPSALCDLSAGIESPQWFPGAKINIVDSCFKAATEKKALTFYQNGELIHLTYGQLLKLTNQIANGLKTHGIGVNDKVAIIMPMNAYAIAIYLATIKIGAVVVSIADSFSAEEIALRNQIADTKAIFTQYTVIRNSKALLLYEKIRSAFQGLIVILPFKNLIASSKNLLAWNDFLSKDSNCDSYPASAMTVMNILFSSGTTGHPKAIPWNHSVGVKIASDAYLHGDIKQDDTMAWPTNLGWMMGPWLIFAALINEACIALYEDTPTERPFGQFVQDANVTALGVIPTIVSRWRHTDCMVGLNWQKIKKFFSTGECSNPEDMLYLMSLAGYKPIIEYCGGTEIGGAYISSTMLDANYPSLFSTAAMGSQFLLFDEHGNISDQGDVALIPPTLGLSTQLLNADHHQVYFANMPVFNGKPLRKHGDQIHQYENGYYAILGRSDDTMNLGGIKVSAAEIERVLASIQSVNEVAAIGISPLNHGPTELIIFAALESSEDTASLKNKMQQCINHSLNPLFKIHKVLIVPNLPRTSSNKVMRRVLRQNYLDFITKEN